MEISSDGLSVSGPSLSIKILYKIIGPGGNRIWAVLDQGLLAGSNLITGILLARWLGASDYGIYTTGYTLFLLIGVLHTAALVEPMSIFGSVDYRSDLRGYLGHLLKMQVFLSLAIALGFLCSSAGHRAFHFGLMADMMLALAMSSGPILTFLMLRRVFYITDQVYHAAAGGAIYLLVTLAGLWIIFQNRQLSLFSAVLIMGAAASLGCIYYLILLRPRFESDKGTLSRIMSGHAGYGRWSLGSGALSWFSGSLPYLALPYFASFEETGKFKAALNLLIPILNVNSSLGLIILPILSRAAVATRPEFKSRLRAMLLKLLLPTAIYCVLLHLFMHQIYTAVYGSRYSDLPAGSWLMVYIPVAGIATMVYSNALRAIKKPEYVFKAYAITSAISATVGVVLIYYIQTIGCSIILLVVTFVNAWLMRKYLLRTTDTKRMPIQKVV